MPVAAAEEAAALGPFRGGKVRVPERSTTRTIPPAAGVKIAPVMPESPGSGSRTSVTSTKTSRSAESPRHGAASESDPKAAGSRSRCATTRGAGTTAWPFSAGPSRVR